MSQLQQEFMETLYEENYDANSFLLDSEEWEDFTGSLSIQPIEAF